MSRPVGDHRPQRAVMDHEAQPFDDVGDDVGLTWTRSCCLERSTNQSQCPRGDGKGQRVDGQRRTGTDGAHQDSGDRRTGDEAQAEDRFDRSVGASNL